MEVLVCDFRSLKLTLKTVVEIFENGMRYPA